MTKEEILLYLDNEDASKSKGIRLTRIYFGTRQTAIVHFHKKDQSQELIAKNKWIIYSLDNKTDQLAIDGNDITDLKSGRSDADA